ncbi:hypothetical protein OTK01_000318 [Caldicellulosiruptor acetigenus]|uniref:hypothetical protein n=1 Tax=Caldicellulosiruptor acetigenus TaxID=301953 RepID=UPI0022A99954|nr:hypothetical protein [Caldicellulosiruptor acetigenus]WAM36544.1 hypothetical protein OTK01_000318 [Caldicellulosiruptor acetigenus]
MVQINEKDRQLIDLILKYKMLPYKVVKEVYNTGKRSAYHRLEKLKDDEIVRKISKEYVTLGEEGIKYVEDEYGIKFSPLPNPRSPMTVSRWKSVFEIGYRPHIRNNFTTCWDFKSEKGISDKNKVLGIANGYGIFKIPQNMSKKAMTEILTDVDELCDHRIERFIVLCESGERLQEFTEVASSKNSKARAIHVLPYSSSGMQLMDVIVAIPDWKQKVINAVYSNVMPSRYPFFDCEAKGRQVYVGIDGEILSKSNVKSNVISGIRAEVEVLCLAKQEWRFADIPGVKIRTIAFKDFLQAVGYGQPAASSNNNTKQEADKV